MLGLWLEVQMVENWKECDYCYGPVDIHGCLLQCRNCYAVGDVLTGIMEPPLKEPTWRRTIELSCVSLLDLQRR